MDSEMINPMDSEMIKMIMALELIFFFIAGAQISQHRINCIRNEAQAVFYLSLSPEALSQIRI